MIKPFPWPKKPLRVDLDGDRIRGQFNQLAKAISGQASPNISTSAAVIFEQIINSAAGWVNGDDGLGNIFADQVAWNGTTNTKVVISSSTIAGSPAARTYTVVAGELKLAMASGTYTITVVPVVFTN